MKKLNLFIKKKEKFYELIVINKNSLKSKNEKQITKKTQFLSIIIQQHYKKIFFNIVSIINYNIVLKLF